MKTYDDIEFRKTQEIKNLQNELLREVIDYVFNNSPFYKKYYYNKGIKAGDIRGIGDLKELPFTERAYLQSHNADFLAIGKDKVAETVVTSGTSGEPVYIYMTRSDLERLAYNEQKSFACAGVQKGERFLIAVTCDNLFIAGIAYYSGLIRLGANVARLGPQNTLRQLAMLRDLKPEGIVGVPSLMLELSRLMKKEGIRIEELGLKRLVLIGDSIRNHDFTSNTLGRLIEDSFGRITYSTYGITEGQSSFCECPERQGLHCHPELIIPEVIDEDGNSLPYGEVGELVITTLQIEGVPLIRYKTGDITFLIAGRCGCGRNSVRIGPILGRKYHKLKFKGVTLFPKSIENALLELDDVVNYQIEAYSGEDSTDRIILRVGTNRNDKAYFSILKDTLQAMLRVTPEIVIESPEILKRRLYEGGSRKAKVFVDRREKRQ